MASRSWTRRSSPASTDFSAELTRIKNSTPRRCGFDGHASRTDDREAVQAAAAAATACADRGERLFAVPPGHVRGRERRDRELVPATAWAFLPKTSPVRKEAARPAASSKRPVSNFDGDAAGALWAYKAAIERGSATRAGINDAPATKLRGLVTPAGRIYLLANEPPGPPYRLDVGREDPELLSGRSSARPSRRRSSNASAADAGRHPLRRS